MKRVVRGQELSTRREEKEGTLTLAQRLLRQARAAVSCKDLCADSIESRVTAKTMKIKNLLTVASAQEKDFPSTNINQQLFIIQRNCYTKLTSLYLEQAEKEFSDFQAYLLSMADQEARYDDSDSRFVRGVKSFRSAARCYGIAKKIGVTFEDEKNLLERMEILSKAVVTFLIPTVDIALIVGDMTRAQLEVVLSPLLLTAKTKP